MDCLSFYKRGDSDNYWKEKKSLLRVPNVKHFLFTNRYISLTQSADKSLGPDFVGLNKSALTPLDGNIISARLCHLIALRTVTSSI